MPLWKKTYKETHDDKMSELIKRCAVRIVKEVKEFKPDILYVGFGMPLQEQWINHNIQKIEAKVFLPLGACLDFYTGSVYRGPSFMTNAGFEWLSRLITEPKRLWKRYLIGNLEFLYRVAIDYLYTWIAKH